MISAWKRFINKNDVCEDVNGPNGLNGVPPGIQKLDKDLQRKFARGVNYNMKVVIKGDNRVGKTALFLRLRGYGFDDNYNPTENLNVTSINWNYKATDDIVKIDLWEAIDSTSKRSINFVDLKTENKNGSDSTPNGTNNELPTTTTTITHTPLSMNGSALNNPIPESAKQSLAELSENLDVYKGTNAVLLVMDMTKLWTFKYIQSELPKVPKHIPVLVIANHRDQGHHRTVSTEQVKSFIEGLDRNPCDGIVMYTEASMKNGFGLKLIDKFFSIPFLRLQETSLLKQLELNRCDYMSTLEELQLMEASVSREYEQHLELQTIIRRQQADAMSPVNSGLRQLDETTREQIRNATMSSDETTRNKADLKSIESTNDKQLSKAQVMASQNFVNDRLPSIVMGAKCPLPEAKAIQMNVRQQLPMNNQAANGGNNDNARAGTVKTETGGLKSEAERKGNVADDGGYNDEDDDDDDEDEEEPRANPLVAGYQSDLDSDDQVQPDKTDS